MFVFEVGQTGIKNAMNQLLRENTFDFFEVRGVEIIAMTKFEISGILDKEPMDKGEGEENKELIDEIKQPPRRNFCTWAELRPFAFNIIKGNRRPRSIKAVFSYPARQVELFHENAAALFLNMTYENDGIIFTTATSQKNFSMERKMDDMWEEYIKVFIGQHIKE